MVFVLRAGGVVAASALVLGLAACGGQAVSGTAQPAAGAASSAPAASSPLDASGEGNTKTAAGALKSWVTQVLQQQYAEACKASAPVAAPGQDPATVCASEDLTRTLSALHDAWAKPGVKLPPEGKVTVDTLSPTGDSVTVPDTAISLDGRTLRDLELIGSSGDTSSFSLSLEMTKQNGTWYVSDWHIDV